MKLLEMRERTLLPQRTLTPRQQSVAEGALAGISAAEVVLIRGDAGMGRTTIMEHLRDQTGGLLIGAAQFVRRMSDRHPLAFEENFLQVMEESLEGNDLVLVDDLGLLTDVAWSHRNLRPKLFSAMLVVLLESACLGRKKLVFASDEATPWPIERHALNWDIGSFSPEDYREICEFWLGERFAGRIDYAQVHQFAPKLNGHHLKKACLWLRREPALNTARLLDYLRSVNLISNVQTEDVAPVRWEDLKGVDDVIRDLEGKVALPFENHELAAELQLKPRRGVLLAGPPGTGKTTVGRALAHRLKGKFFLVDGTMMSGSSDFHESIRELFENAVQNSPSIIFIDDADVLFEGRGDRALQRYLLTMLDGLAGAKAERVCVMMTAMNPADLPAAVVRSGRIELWLEMRLPDREARAEILREKLVVLPAPVGLADVDLLAAASRGMTGADLKSAVEDGKLSFAQERVAGGATRAVEDYFLESFERIRKNKRSYRRPKPVATDVVKLGFQVE